MSGRLWGIFGLLDSVLGPSGFLLMGIAWDIFDCLAFTLFLLGILACLLGFEWFILRIVFVGVMFGIFVLVPGL